jgi:hypothetical protein
MIIFKKFFIKALLKKEITSSMKTSLNLAVLGIDHGHIFDMLDEMIIEGCHCNYFWTEGLTLNIKRVQ